MIFTSNTFSSPRTISILFCMNKVITLIYKCLIIDFFLCRKHINICSWIWIVCKHLSYVNLSIEFLKYLLTQHCVFILMRPLPQFFVARFTFIFSQKSHDTHLSITNIWREHERKMTQFAFRVRAGNGKRPLLPHLNKHKPYAFWDKK